MNLTLKEKLLAGAAMAAGTVMAQPAMASSTGNLPWETSGQVLMNSLTGPMASIMAFIVIVGAGWYIATAEGSGLTQRLAKIASGVAITGSVGLIASNVFGITKAAGFL